MKKRPSTYDYKQSPFFKLTTKRKLADLLKVTLEDLERLRGLSSEYRRSWLHKKIKNFWLNEEPSLALARLYRPIDIPPKDLKSAQAIIEGHLSRIQLPDNVYSPVKGRSYVDNAVAHRGAASVYSMDVENYFPSTRREKVINYFLHFMLCSPDVSVILADIVTKDGGLPQGSPCSPVLAYLANQKMWSSITEAVKAAECTATVYADDLTISGAVVPRKLVYDIRKIIENSGLSVKSEKDKSSYKRPSKITGVIVRDQKLLLPNEKHKLLMEARLALSKAANDIERAAAANKLRSRQSQKNQIDAANF